MTRTRLLFLIMGLAAGAAAYMVWQASSWQPWPEVPPQPIPESVLKVSQGPAKAKGNGPAFKSANAHYVGVEACRECHAKRVQKFKQTRHFQTSSEPHDGNMMGDHLPGKNILLTRNENLRFQLSKKGKGFHLSALMKEPSTGMEHRREEKIALVIGSGKIATVLAYWRGNQLFQLPIGHFTSLGGLANCPGFPDGNTTFEKPIVARCLDCHATYFKYRPGSLNQYEQEGIIFGVTCGRCHGPGSEHVRYHRQFPKEKIGRHIVAPSSLTRDQRLQMCGQCHGDPGKLIKPPFTYIPGQPLESYVIQERQDSGPAAQFIHTANQSFRLGLSSCYRKSEDLECISCHTPHSREKDVHRLSLERCLECHKTQHCPTAKALPLKAQMGCVACHMPKRPATDTPINTREEDYCHLITLTEHRIGIHRGSKERYLFEWYGAQDSVAFKKEAENFRVALDDLQRKVGFGFNEKRSYMAAICAFKDILKRSPEDEAARKGLEQAISGQRKADQARAHNDYGIKLLREGKPREADELFRKALEFDHTLVDAHVNLGLVAAQSGRVKQAIQHFKGALHFDPKNQTALFNLGVARLRSREFEPAVERFRQLLKLNANHAVAHCNLGVALGELGEGAQAVEHYRACRKILPEHQASALYLAWLLATLPEASMRNGREAVALAQEVVKKQKQADPRALDTLAAAYAETGNFKLAVQYAESALRAATQLNRKEVASGIERRLLLYQLRKPFRQAGRQK